MSKATRLARAFSARVGLDGEAADHLALVVEEWVANVVEHGRAPHASLIGLRLRFEDGVVRLALSDGGRPFDPRAAAFDGPNHARGGGAGLALVASLCRITAYARRRGRNRVELELDVC